MPSPMSPIFASAHFTGIGFASTKSFWCSGMSRWLIAIAFFALALFLSITSVRSLVLGLRPSESPLGIAYLALTATVMFTLAGVKRRTARAMDSGPLEAEASMTFLDGCLCIGILTALGVNIVFGWWWADAVAALGIGVFAAREGRESLQESRREG